jgi:hypothetical protein
MKRDVRRGRRPGGGGERLGGLHDGEKDDSKREKPRETDTVMGAAVAAEDR